MNIKIQLKETNQQAIDYNSCKLLANYVAANGTAQAGKLAVTKTGQAIFPIENNLTGISAVTFSLKSADGAILFNRDVATTELAANTTLELRFSAAGVQLRQPDVSFAPAKSMINGRLLDKQGKAKMDEVQIIIYANSDEVSPSFLPILNTVTESGGYFVLPYPLGTFVEAYAVVGLKTTAQTFPLSLEALSNSSTQKVFPSRIILVVEIETSAEEVEAATGCGCDELGNFHEQKRVLEEFAYCSLVRTSDPEINAYTIVEEEEVSLDDFLDVAPRLKKAIVDAEIANVHSIFLRPRTTAPVPLAALAATEPASAVAAITGAQVQATLKNYKIKKSIANEFLERYKMLNKDTYQKLIDMNEAAKQNQFLRPRAPRILGRTALDALNQIDWDETPTEYHATSLAFGHILHYKQQWIADGYSLGDLVYSLPLAPGQKKQIVMIDWDRREKASNTQSITNRESLENTLSRDRDINEVANGVLSESMDGSSTASVASGGGGFGGALGPIVFGVAGGYSRGSSTASQDSMRSTAVSNSQSLSDRTTQSASAVRSQRSTVIQTVNQNEDMEVTAESVANYNHCHAITIQYFEVLRHFKVQQRLTDVEECLFVPLPISTFDIAKTLRWRESLQRTLKDRSLKKAFDALQRAQDQWENSNLPATTIAAEQIRNLSGSLRISFNFARPADVEVIKTRKITLPSPPYPIGAITDEEYTEYEFSANNWAWMEPLLNDSAEEFYNQFLRPVKHKDDEFRRQLGHRIAKAIVDKLELRFVDKNGETSAPASLDASLSSQYKQGRGLSVSLRVNPPINYRRENVLYVKLSVKAGTLLPANTSMMVQSGGMVYSTDHYTGTLFNNSSINNDLADGDDVVIFTPTTQDEMRNPKKDDVDLVNRLLQHLNANLEFYHGMIFRLIQPDKRFMLLDGIKVMMPKRNATDPDEWRSVASVVANRLISIVGNSMVFPVVAGLHLNPDFKPQVLNQETGEMRSLIDYYQHEPLEPKRISVPTKGVFAEAMMGKCNSCEIIDEKRFWRWEQSPIPDSPTAINPVSTDSRRAEPNLPTPVLANPIINLQNAPNAPDPSGISGLLNLLGKGDSFRDITGLTENQKNALEGLKASLSTASSFGTAGLDLKKANLQHELDRGKMDAEKAMREKKLATMKDLFDNNKINQEDFEKYITNEGMDPDLKKTIDVNKAAASKQITTRQQGALDPATKKETIASDDVAARVNTIAHNFDSSLSKITTDSDGNVTIEAQKGSSQAPVVSLDVQSVNSSEALCFNQGKLSLDGYTILHAYVNKTLAAKAAKFNWVNVNEGSIELINKTPRSVQVQGLKPGLANVLFDVRDASNQALGYETVPVSVPQYYRIFESADYLLEEDRIPPLVNRDDARNFDSVLAYTGILADKVWLYRKAQAVAEDLLKDINVRLVWEMMDEVVPDFIDSDDVATIVLGGFTDFMERIGYAPVIDPVDHNNEEITITMGAIADFASPKRAPMVEPNYEQIKTLVLVITDPDPERDEAFVQSLLPLWREIFARTFGFAIAHEICHTLLKRRGHTSAFDEDDLMGAGFDNADIGLEITERDRFPLEGSYQWSPLKRLNAINLKAIREYLPIAADDRFMDFLQMSVVR